MPEKIFDPIKFIDRRFEQELFEHLLGLQDGARILAIRDAGGMGKTHLLEMLNYRCRTVQPRTPVSFVSLEEIPTGQPLDLVRRIARDLQRAFNLRFPTFQQMSRAREAGDFATIDARINLQGASFDNARDVRIAKVIVEGRNAQIQMSAERFQLTAGQEEVAQEACIDAFFADLGQICAEQTVVLLIDSFEKCEESLANWLLEPFLHQQFFEPQHRPRRLLLVIAGRSLPQFELQWAQVDVEVVVRSVCELGKWEKRDVEECLRVHGYDYEQQDLDAFHRLVELRLPPAMIVQAIQAAALNRREDRHG